VSRLPRILPLIGVAIAGVFAVNALAGARSLPDLISAARAFAETAPAKVRGPKVAAPKTGAPTQVASADTAHSASALPPSATAIGMSTAPGAALPANADALCLASRAGLSPAEMKMIQDLQTRRGQLDQRESDLDLQLKLVEAAEAKLNTKLNDLTGLKGDIAKLLGQVDDKQAAETARLVKVYANMKPQQAAADLAVLTDEVRLPIVTSPAMKEAVLSAILNKMPTAAAKDLTEKMAQRFAAGNVVTQAKTATAAAAAAAGLTPPAAGSAPAPKGQAAAPAAAPKIQAAAPAPADAKTADTPPAKPKKVASAPKRKALPAKPKAPAASDAAAPMVTKPDPTATG
jgi:flagellar motility protein MotE (MotC chaperone)